jgi:hypothetical protein
MTLSRRSERQRRARTGLFLGLCLFALANLVLLVLLQSGAIWCGDPFYGPRLARLRRRTLTAPHSPCVVMVGSSRTYYGLRAARLEERLARQRGEAIVAFNFGRPGAGPVNFLHTWRRLCQAGIRPELLLLEVPPFLTGATPSHDEVNPVLLPTTSLSRADLPVVARYAQAWIDQPGWDWLRVRALPCLGYRRHLLNRAVPWSLPRELRDEEHTPPLLNDFGDCPGYVEFALAQRREAAQATARNFKPCLDGPMPGQRPAAALGELLANCRDKGVRVALVLLPEPRPQLQAWIPGRLHEFESFVQALAHEHDASVVDGRHWVDDDDFNDGVHLTREGAERFTDRLTGSVRPLLDGPR